MNKMYYVRHGENTANITKEFSYKIIDYSLTEKGRLQAEQTAEVFRSLEIDEIWSSPLKRAFETASYISKLKKLEINLLEELREVNIGTLELLKPSKESWDIYLGVFNEWKSGNLEYHFPDGESYIKMVERFEKSMKAIFSGKNNKKIVVVGHGGIFSSCVWNFFDKDKRKPFTAENNNCSISEIDIEVIDNELKCGLVKFGDYSHLSGEAAEIISGYPDFIKREHKL